MPTFPACAALPRTQSVAPSVQEKPPTVLVIDDDKYLCEAIRRRCRRHGIEVLQAHGGADGFRLAVTQKPDVVVTDLLMPRGQGDDVVLALKANPRTSHIPVLLITGLPDCDRIDEVRSLGVARILHKPFALTELLGAIFGVLP